jgi:hypothetical protein
MSPTTRLAGLVGLMLMAGLAYTSGPPTPGEPAPNYRISGPFTHDNLTIFFLHGTDRIKNKKILTLEEALKDKKIIVHETKNVNQLSIENVSTDEVFVQAGDIVKGGQQDRVIALDLIVPPKSGTIPLSAFCVEQGRWTQRAGEEAKSFNRSNDALVGNDLKRAARATGSGVGAGTGTTTRTQTQTRAGMIRAGVNPQGEVWRGVANAQAKLKMQLKANVMSPASSSSLGLTLEHKKVLEAVDAYVKKLQDSLDKQTDVIGYAVAINGKVNNADVYVSADLFRKLWPKLLKSSAVEALTEKKDKLKIEPVKPEAVTAFLVAPCKGKKSEKKLIQSLVECQLDGDKNILIETRTQAGTALRSSYVGK